mmetsp:Transcript_364/g.423  ORF Transcript_364/g.423 Transcript_364/m.423 type:complete len:324 (+) Transcript_364:276-1247(+)
MSKQRMTGNKRKKKLPSKKKDVKIKKKQTVKIIETTTTTKKKKETLKLTESPKKTKVQQSKTTTDMKKKDTTAQQQNGKNLFVVEAFSNENNTTSSYINDNKKQLIATTLNQKNELTDLIPGYTAPFELKASTASSSLLTISELRHQAQRTDVSTQAFCRTDSSLTTNKNPRNGFLPQKQQKVVAYGTKFQPKTNTPDSLTAGKGWFNMVSHTVTDDIKADMAVIRQRTYLDPKRFYKSADAFGKHIQVGTVVDSSMSSMVTGRLSNKQRQSTLLDEIRFNDDNVVSYTHKKYQKIQQERKDATNHFHSKRRKTKTKQQRRGY